MENPGDPIVFLRQRKNQALDRLAIGLGLAQVKPSTVAIS